MTMIDEQPVEVAKQVEVIAKPGETMADEKGVQREVLEITIGKDGVPRYKLDSGHQLVLVSEDKAEATFECSYCRARIAFALPGLGEPAASGSVGAWEPHPDFMKWMALCSTS